MKHVVALAAWLLLACLSFGQTPTGTIQGTITDPSGSAIPGAKVQITNTQTGEVKNIQSEGSGNFVQPFLLPGTYNVAVDASGFQKTAQNNIKLDVGQNRALTFQLPVGSSTQNVVVEAAAPALDTASATMGQVIENKRVVDLPLNGRNIFDLSSLAPTVTTVGNNASTPHIGGGRNGTSEIQIDGITDIAPENNVGNSSAIYTPQVDETQEFSISTNALSAEYGRFGGGVVNVVTKSGTNEYHGTAYDFLRNQVLDANDFFANRNGQPRNGFKRNQWGGVLGGPVQIPKLYNGKDKTFFFVAFQGTNQRNQQTYTGTVPTDQWRGGDFSNLRDASGNPITIYDPLTAVTDPTNPGNAIRQPFSGNIIPSTRFNPVALNALQYYPRPNVAPTNPFTNANNFFASGIDNNNAYQYSIRADHNISDKWRIFGRYSHVWSNDTPPNFFGNLGTPGGSAGANGPGTGNSWAADIDNTITLSPTLILNLRYGFIRSTSARSPFSTGFDLTSLGLPASYQQTAALNATEFPQFAMGGSTADFGQAGYTDLYEAPAAHDFIASITKVAGKHTVKAGFEFRKLLINFTQYGNPSGQFNFGRNWTQQDILNSGSNLGFPFASFLLGLPDSGNITNDPSTATANNYFAGYIQDDWKLARNFTLNWGLRYEVSTPRTERYDRLSYFDFNAQSPLQGALAPNACAYCGDLRGAVKFANADNRQQVPTQFFNYAPRIGFAWSVTPKTVIRSGYGISYAPSAFDAAGSSGSLGTLGFSSYTNLNSTFDGYRTVAATLGNPFPGGTLLPTGNTLGDSTFLGQNVGGGAGGVYDSYRNPMIQQWNFNIQRQLPLQMTLEAGYIGQRGTHLPDGEGGQSFTQLPVSDLALGSQLTTQVANPFASVITDPTSPLSSSTIAYNNLLRPFPQYNGVSSYRTPIASSNYHAFILRVDKRFANSLSMSLSYTKSRSMDDSSSSVNFLGPGIGGGHLDAYNRRLDYSVSSFDVPQSFVLSYNYELPFGRGKKFAANLPKAVNFFVSGWQANGLMNFSSGTPIFINGANNTTGIFTPTQRPDNNGQSAHIDGGNTNDRLNQWFNTSVFSQPAPFTLGNTARTLPDVRNPGVNNVDLSFFKNNYFGPEGKLNVQYRLEMFNALNAVQFAGPDTGLFDGNFGQITSTAHAARQIQMALKFVF